eukprot:jgi/Mesen1/4965/ME000248S04253
MSSTWLHSPRKFQGQTKYLASLVAVLHVICSTSGAPDYESALSKSLIFYEGQRSGILPTNPVFRQLKWRGDSALNDISSTGVNLVGGYYDAGDNVKFGLPMAFSMTMLAWSLVEYGAQFAASGELENARFHLKWGTDYFVKAHSSPNELWAEVGEGNSDHACWQRPEFMTTPRPCFRVDPAHPGSDVAGETAAAMAAASMVFQDSSPASFSGYNDELLWAAAWLYRATGEQSYLQFVAGGDSAQYGGQTTAVNELSWDNKYAGAQTVLAIMLLTGAAGATEAQRQALGRYRNMAEQYVCVHVEMRVPHTPEGLVWIREWSPLQYTVNAALVVAVYGDYLQQAGQALSCGGGAPHAWPKLLKFSASQADYILGANRAGQSYMVGYGPKYPLRPHHRGASLPDDGVRRSCTNGYATYSGSQPNPNVLVGAVVGGPDMADNFNDQRSNFRQTEPSTYLNAAFTGALARLTAGTRAVTPGTPVPTPGTPVPPPATGVLVGGDGDGLVVLVLRVVNSWVHAETTPFQQVEVTVTNTSPAATVAHVVLTCERFSARQFWNIWKASPAGGGAQSLCRLPDYVPALVPGGTFTFGYVQETATPPSFAVHSYILNNEE